MTTSPDLYAHSRERFRARLDSLREGWPTARLTSLAQPWEGDLTTDVLTAHVAQEGGSPANPPRLIVLSSGLHGIEGYFRQAFSNTLTDLR